MSKCIILGIEIAAKVYKDRKRRVYDSEANGLSQWLDLILYLHYAWRHGQHGCIGLMGIYTRKAMIGKRNVQYCENEMCTYLE